jgi:hypothetical protein
LQCVKQLQYYERGLNYESNFYFILRDADEHVTKYGIINTIFVGLECCKDWRAAKTGVLQRLECYKDWSDVKTGMM